MKKYLLIGSVLVILTLLTVVFAIPVLAHGSEDGGTTPANHEAWEAMHKACEEGDWETMTEAAEEVHGGDFGSMSCHDEDDYSSEEGDRIPSGGWGGMGGHMGSDKMGGSWGGMM